MNFPQIINIIIAPRIVLSALYWGVEEKEQKLRDAVSHSLTNTPGLRVKILLDWCRGTRLVGGQSSVTLLSHRALLLSSLPTIADMV